MLASAYLGLLLVGIGRGLFAGTIVSRNASSVLIIFLLANIGHNQFQGSIMLMPSMAALGYCLFGLRKKEGKVDPICSHAG